VQHQSNAERINEKNDWKEKTTKKHSSEKPTGEAESSRQFPGKTVGKNREDFFSPYWVARSKEAKEWDKE